MIPNPPRSSAWQWWSWMVRRRRGLRTVSMGLLWSFLLGNLWIMRPTAYRDGVDYSLPQIPVSASTHTTSNIPNKPRVVFFSSTSVPSSSRRDDLPTDLNPPTRSRRRRRSRRTHEREHDDDDDSEAISKLWNSPDCRPQQQDQQNYPTCNLAHELQDVLHCLHSQHGSSPELTFLGKGVYRTAWLVNDVHNKQQYVFKTLRHETRTPRTWRNWPLTKLVNQIRIDAFASQTLGPQHAIAAYAYCGYAMYTEVAQKTLWNEIEDEQDDASSEQLAGYAMQVAALMAHLHNTTNMVHGDLHVKNIMVRGERQLVLNDFNLALEVHYHNNNNNNNDTSGVCHYSARHSAALDMSRRPPERFYANYYDPVAHELYSMGIMLAEMYLGRSHPFLHLPRDEYSQPRVVMVPAPQHHRRGDNVMSRAVLQAALSCLSFKPANRPTAQQVLEGLRQAMLHKDDNTLPDSQLVRWFTDSPDDMAKVVVVGEETTA